MPKDSMIDERTKICFDCSSNKIIIVQLTAVVIFLTLLFNYGCLSKKPVFYNELTLKVERGGYPKSMAVLPFINNSTEEKIDELVRISFYSHFSARPYRDIELHQIDNIAIQKEKINLNTPSRSDLKNWGRMMDCDALIIGEVTQFKRIYLGIYSQIKLAGHITIWDAKTGQKIWDDQHVVRSHEGGVPFHLAEVPLIAIKTGLNLLEKEKVRAADELCRYLTGRIPAPLKITNEKQTVLRYTYELQVGAFIDEDRADLLLGRLREKGYPAFIRKKEKESVIWNRVILGPYEKKLEAIEVKNKIRNELNIQSFIVPKNKVIEME